MAQQTVPAPLTLRLGLSIFLPFAAGYFLSYLFRTVNAVIATDLQTDLGLSAGQLGLMTSLYFLSFASFQLPLGVLLDRFGPRRVEALLLLAAAMGSLLFARAEGFAGLSLGRLLIGLGVSACLMASIKAFVLWFPPRHLALANGWLLAFGGLGALAATRPTELALDSLGWRGVFLVLACACLGTALAIWWIVPDHDEQRGLEHPPLRAQFAALGQIFRDPLFWKVAPIAALSHGAGFAVIGLWSGAWLRDVAGLDRPEVANVLLGIAVAVTLAFAAWGTLASWLQRFGVPITRVAIVGLLLLVASNLALTLQITSLTVQAWLLFGFTSTVGTLFYSVLSQHFDSSLSGRVNTSLNLVLFTTAFSLQWGMGIVIESWASIDGGPHDTTGYGVAFGLLAVMQTVALAWFLWPLRRS